MRFEILAVFVFMCAVLTWELLKGERIRLAVAAGGRPWGIE